MTVVLDREALQTLLDGALLLAAMHKHDTDDTDEIGEVARIVIRLFQPDESVDLHEAPLTKQ